MSAHTPGEWRAEIDKRDDIAPGQPRIQRAEIHAGHEWIASVALRQHTFEHAEANARLIAAAPDLLEGLLHVRYSNHGYYPSACSACEAAEKAVAKASGKP